jgi:hypothetical protein
MAITSFEQWILGIASGSESCPCRCRDLFIATPTSTIGTAGTGIIVTMTGMTTIGINNRPGPSRDPLNIVRAHSRLMHSGSETLLDWVGFGLGASDELAART